MSSLCWSTLRLLLSNDLHNYAYDSGYDCEAVRVEWRNLNRVLSRLSRNKSTYYVNIRDSSVRNNPNLECKISKADSISRVFGKKRKSILLEDKIRNAYATLCSRITSQNPQ